MCARDHRGNDGLAHILTLEPLDGQELHQPDRIFITRTARIGSDAPARLDGEAVKQRENDIGVADIDGEQHGFPSRFSLNQQGALRLRG